MSNASMSVSRPVDGASFRLAYRRHYPDVRNFARRAGIPEPEIDDVVQDVFIVLHRRWHELECPLRATPWIRNVSAHVCANHRRSARRSRDKDKTPLEPDDFVAPPRLLPEQQAIRREEGVLLERALACLTATQRQLLVMIEIEERTTKELASMTGSSAGTVASRLRTARRKLQRELARHLFLQRLRRLPSDTPSTRESTP